MDVNEFVAPVRITVTDGDVARVSARRHQFVVGRPIEFDAESSRLSALEYFLGAVGAEIVGGLKLIAKRRRLELHAVEALVTGRVDHPLALLEVVGEPGRPRVAAIHVKLYVASPAGEPTVRRLWEEAREHLPLVCTLSDSLHLDVQLSFVG
jgi:hypothetical protein